MAQHAQYSSLLSSGLKFIERSNHVRSASTSDVPIPRPPMKPLPAQVRPTSLQPSIWSHYWLPSHHPYAQREDRPPSTIRRSRLSPDSANIVGAEAIDALPPSHPDGRTSYLSMDDSDSESDSESEGKDTQSTFLDFSDAASLASRTQDQKPLSKALNQPALATLCLPPSVGSFLSFSPLMQDPDSPVVTTPSQPFTFPPRDPSVRSAKQRRAAESEMHVTRRLVADEQMNVFAHADADDEGLPDDWRIVVDNLMDIPED